MIAYHITLNYITLHFIIFYTIHYIRYISSHFVAFHCISLHFIGSIAFHCISLHFATLYFVTFHGLGGARGTLLFCPPAPVFVASRALGRETPPKETWLDALVVGARHDHALVV